MSRAALRGAVAAALLVLIALPAAAQGTAAQSSAAASTEALTARANAGTVGVISGGIDGTYVRIAADLAGVLDDGDRLRVLPVIGKGSVQNIADILYLHGIDIGIVQSDVLAYARRQHLFPGMDQAIQYIAKLYDEEVHILARRDIAKVEDLAGQAVNVDRAGSGTAMTAAVLFDALGVKVQPENDAQDVALDKLRRGEIAAIVYVAGKPARLFTDIPPDSGLHFLSVPMNQALLETYLPAQLAAADYPALVTADAPVDTVAVGAVMAVFAWAPSSDRYAKVARFVDAFFTHFPEFQQPPHHPKWRDVNLAAQVPGWTRFAPAQDALRRVAVAANGPVQADFTRFLASAGNGATLSDAQRDALFRQFLAWQRAQR